MHIELCGGGALIATWRAMARGSAASPNRPVLGAAARGLAISTLSGRAPARGVIMVVENAEKQLNGTTFVMGRLFMDLPCNGS